MELCSFYTGNMVLALCQMTYVELPIMLEHSHCIDIFTWWPPLFLCFGRRAQHLTCEKKKRKVCIIHSASQPKLCKWFCCESHLSDFSLQCSHSCNLKCCVFTRKTILCVCLYFSALLKQNLTGELCQWWYSFQEVLLSELLTVDCLMCCQTKCRLGV